MNEEQLQARKETAETLRATLEEAKSKGGRSWNEDKNADLEEVTAELSEIAEIAVVETKYVPQEGTEGNVHAIISRSVRYDSVTGKRIEEPYFQLFTKGEWDLFEKYHTQIGFTIEQVLYNPFAK